jgi:hypothetical protein
MQQILKKLNVFLQRILIGDMAFVISHALLGIVVIGSVSRCSITDGLFATHIEDRYITIMLPQYDTR